MSNHTMEGPAKLIMEVAEVQLKSLARAREVRSNMVFGSCVFMTAVVVPAILLGLRDGYIIALTIAASTLCICWAIMSSSGSLHSQFDTITKILVHYAEKSMRAK